VSDDLLLERLLQVIDEGRRTATYKLALLSALIEAAALAPGREDIPTRAIAGLVVAQYLHQVRTYVSNDGSSHDLRQITNKRSVVLNAIAELHHQAGLAGVRSLADIQVRLQKDYAETVDKVEDTFVRYPIPLLQVIGSETVPFLYEADWPEQTRAKVLRAEGRDRIRLLPGVGDRLVVLGPLLRPLIELHWAADVAKWSGIPTEDERLRAHLFGAERTRFPSKVRNGLLELQRGRCFYCDEPITGAVQVDHFLAWSRWPNDAIENLVAADSCNGSKSAHLVAEPHLRRWRERLDDCGRSLAAMAHETRWPSDAARSSTLVTSTYGHVVAGTPLWLRGREFVPARGPIAV
jgi:hypothetical protein